MRKVIGSSPISSTKKEAHPVGCASFLIWTIRTRTHLNATVQWTVAEFRLDGIHTLMLSSPISSTVKAERFEFMKQEFCVCSKTYRNLRLWTLRGQCSCPGKNIEKKPAQGALPKSRPLENPPAAPPEALQKPSDCIGSVTGSAHTELQLKSLKKILIA